MPEIERGRKMRERAVPTLVERAQRPETAAFEVMVTALARYGAAASPEERQAALVAARAAKRAYMAARARTIDAAYLEGGRAMLRHLDGRERDAGRPGSRWSADRTEGWRAAVLEFSRWLYQAKTKLQAAEGVLLTAMSPPS